MQRELRKGKTEKRQDLERASSNGKKLQIYGLYVILLSVINIIISHSFLVHILEENSNFQLNYL